MQKEGHTVAWQGRGIKPWATEAPLHSKRAAARATRTRGRPEENIRPRLHVANANPMASPNAKGRCHPITAEVPTNQHNTGCVRRRSNDPAGRPPRSTLFSRKHFDVQLSSMTSGDPAKTRGAATVINRRCFTMW